MNKYRVSKGIEDYGPGPQTILENASRKKTLELLDLKEKLNISDNLKLKVKGNTGKSLARIINGTITEKNNCFIVVKSENYIECFGYTDFLIGKAIIL